MKYSIKTLYFMKYSIVKMGTKGHLVFFICSIVAIVSIFVTGKMAKRFQNLYEIFPMSRNHTKRWRNLNVQVILLQNTNFYNKCHIEKKKKKTYERTSLTLVGKGFRPKKKKEIRKGRMIWRNTKISFTNRVHE